MLKRENNTLGLLGYLGSEGGVRNSSAFGFATNVKDDRTSFGVKRLIVDEISLLPSVVLSWCKVVGMIDNLIKPLNVLLKVEELLFEGVLEPGSKNSNEDQRQ